MGSRTNSGYSPVLRPGQSSHRSERRSPYPYNADSDSQENFEAWGQSFAVRAPVDGQELPKCKRCLFFFIPEQELGLEGRPGCAKCPRVAVFNLGVHESPWEGRGRAGGKARAPGSYLELPSTGRETPDCHHQVPSIPAGSAGGSLSSPDLAAALEGPGRGGGGVGSNPLLPASVPALPWSHCPGHGPRPSPQACPTNRPTIPGGGFRE